jgi:hypothetical protein
MRQVEPQSQVAREAVLFWKKEPKNFHSLSETYPKRSAPAFESLFASFSSEKEGLPSLNPDL